jgi:putative sigma-54 modulation protein
MRLTQLLGSNIDLTEAIKNYIDERIATIEKLSAHFEPDVELRVEVGKTTKHHAKGSVYRTELNLAIPGKAFRTEATGEDLYETIDKAKDQLRRQLQQHKEKLTDRSQRVVRPGKE